MNMFQETIHIMSLFTFVTTQEKGEFVDVIMLSIEPSVFWGQLVFKVIKLSIKNYCNCNSIVSGCLEH